MMLRRLLFIPISALVSVAFGFLWFSIFSSASFDQESALRSALGLAPLFLGRFFAVAIFITLGTMIAPKPGTSTVAILGVLGGVYGWPFGPQYYVGVGGSTFYLTEGLGAILGSAAGMLISFNIRIRNRMCKKKNQDAQ